LPPPPEPEIAADIESGALHPAASWIDSVGYVDDGDHYEAAVAVTVNLRFDETRVGIDHDVTWEAVLYPLSKTFDSGNLTEVDHDPRDFIEPDPQVAFTQPAAPLSQSSYFRSLKSDVKKYLDRNETITVYRNRSLKTTSRPNESEADFFERLEVVAQDHADREIAKLRDKYDARIRKLERAHADALRAARSAEEAVNDARWSDRFKIAGSVVDLLSGRKLKVPTTSTRTAKDRMRSAGDKAEQRSQDIDDLNTDLDDEVLEIRQEWRDNATMIETLEIGLEAQDIEVTNTRVVWIRK
jgi:hypothetical protein